MVKKLYFKILLNQDGSDVDGSGFTGIILAYYLALKVVYS